MTGSARHEAWRRALHVASGSLGPLAAAVGPAVARPAFAALVAVAAVAEAARSFSPRTRALVSRVAGGLFRPAEVSGPSGAATLALGYALTWWVFPAPAAEAAIVVAAVADPTAALVGSRLGGGAAKSLAGSLACALAAAAVLVVFHVSFVGIVLGASGAAVAERAPWRGSDNLLVPLVVAALVTWLG